MKPGVRVTGGVFRGRPLRVPPKARPTEGRVREALFSIWGERVDGARVLDLFAGSGVIAFEAAGRGALRVLCVDEDVGALRAIAANASELGEPLVEARRLQLPEGLARLVAGGERFDLVFADPPYAWPGIPELLATLPPVLDRDGEIVIEHASRRDLPLVAGTLVRTGVRHYGESALSFYRPGPAA